MNESFSAFVRVLTAVLWGPHVLLLILLAGVWFTLRGRFMQLTKLPGMTRGALCGTQRCGGFSAFQSLTASLAGSLGTGNILGVAAAILVGGAGAVVWMWIAAFFGMMTVYAEGVLAAKFGTKNAPGAIGYVQKAFGRHGAKIYAAGCVLSALGMGTMAQTGAASSVLVPMGVPRVLAGVVFAGLLLLCVRGGLPKAVRVTEKLVPVHGGAVFGVVRRGAPSARKPYPRRGAEYAERCVFDESRCGRRMRHDFSHARGHFARGVHKRSGPWQRYIRDVPHGK